MSLCAASVASLLLLVSAAALRLHRRLVAYDAESQSRTKVLDLASCWFDASTGRAGDEYAGCETWLTPAQREERRRLQQQLQEAFNAERGNQQSSMAHAESGRSTAVWFPFHVVGVLLSFCILGVLLLLLYCVAVFFCVLVLLYFVVVALLLLGIPFFLFCCCCFFAALLFYCCCFYGLEAKQSCCCWSLLTALSELEPFAHSDTHDGLCVKQTCIYMCIQCTRICLHRKAVSRQAAMQMHTVYDIHLSIYVCMYVRI